MKTITTRSETVPSVDISDETLSFDQLEEIRKDVVEHNVELIRVIFNDHSIIMHRYTDVKQVFEYFQTLETYCVYCGCDIAECNGGFEEPEEHFECAV